MQVFDLGGGKNIRRVWKAYLAEVHGVVFVVDAADPSRFAECKEVLHSTLEQQHLLDKPILVFANKQDLPTAAAAAEVASALGLSELKRNRFNILPCTAKTPTGQAPDARLREGLKWLVGAVDSVFGSLNPRVQAEAEVVRQEEAKKKRERDERARVQREERLRRQKEEAEAAEQAAAAAAAAGEGQNAQENVLSGLPGCIESPKPERAGAGGGVGGADAIAALMPPPLAAPLNSDFSDLKAQRLDQQGGSGGLGAVGGRPFATPLNVQAAGAGPTPIPTIAELPASPAPAGMHAGEPPSPDSPLPPGLPTALPQLPPPGTVRSMAGSVELAPGMLQGLPNHQPTNHHQHSGPGSHPPLEASHSGGNIGVAKTSFTRQNKVTPVDSDTP